MGNVIEKTIDWAAREKRRMVYSAVGKSFLKTITEPLTNSDSAVKNKKKVSHASGLVDLILQLKPNDRLDTSVLKTKIAKAPRGTITLEITTFGKNARVCRVVDFGPGMTAAELETKFGVYAKAKAAGQKTRSLFGRGALDVLLYHENSVIYSVKDGALARCSIFWADDTKIRIEDLGAVSKTVLPKHNLPAELASGGTVVEFKIKEGTSIPLEDQIVDRISRFYMLRLIASDPNIELRIVRTRKAGEFVSSVDYDFPIGTVLGCFNEKVDFGPDGLFDLDVLVARSDEPLQTDPVRIDQRENGLLFVDENDAVLDLTLLPEYDKNPYLQHLFGVVRISRIRNLLESKLEAVDAIDVLTVEREGFNRKHEITQNLFSAIEKLVKPIYVTEEKRQKKGSSSRSDQLTSRVREALKALNDFNKKETDEGDEGRKDPEGSISFSVKAVQLYTGLPRVVWVFVAAQEVKKGEIVLFESDNPSIKVDPETETVTFRKGQDFQKIRLEIVSDIKGQRGVISALTLDKDGSEVKSELRILGVDDPPVLMPPENIEFSATHYMGQPNRSNTATLLVNMQAFNGKPEITFWLDEVTGSVTLDSDGLKRLQLKVTTDMIGQDNVARVPISYNGTGWGQRAAIRAKAKTKEGNVAHARCKVAFERPKGKDKFSDFAYEDLRSTRLGDVAGNIIFVNAGYKPHKQIFGNTPDDFNKQLVSCP